MRAFRHVSSRTPSDNPAPICFAICVAAMSTAAAHRMDKNEVLFTLQGAHDDQKTAERLNNSAGIAAASNARHACRAFEYLFESERRPHQRNRRNEVGAIRRVPVQPASTPSPEASTRPLDLITWNQPGIRRQVG